MTELQKHHPPAPLDISRLDVGPPLVDVTETALESEHYGALVALENRHPAQKKPRTTVEKSIPQKHLPRPPKGGSGPDVRAMSPREMQGYSQDLYAAGIINFDDYEALAFQPDLHPKFNQTIGALIGRKASPDGRRNFIQLWQERLNYVRRYYTADAREVRQAHRILKALMSFPRQADVLAS